MEFDQFPNPTVDDLILDDSVTHVVIHLPGLEFRERFIRLVPRSWIDKAHGKWVCLYPQKKDNALAEEWVKNSLPPRADFSLYEVAILIRTTSFEEGERVLSELVNIDNDENSCNCFGNESTQGRKRPRNSEDFQIKVEEEEELYTEDNTVYTVHSPLRVTPDFTQSIKQEDGVEKSEKNKPIEEYLEERLRVVENRIMNKIESMHRNIIHHLNKKVDEILNVVTSNNEAAIIETPDTINAIDFYLPVENMKQFTELSQTIRDDIEKEKIMKVFLYRVQRGSNNLKTSLSKMLGSTMTKAVQLKFSGQGRKVKGRGKENFSATPLFNCIDDVLCNIFPDIGKAEILSATTKWFSGAADREGGKKLRSIPPKTESIGDPLATCNFS
ncbi:uncharacterized protein LOC117167523 [Belonocnema kinseyi]|uniref:uncharacterized protein LOC117167523 n=1 Tax=Belonocnema kinseyi TaxID=2817044 RepID=UPI00143DCC86|nr:uncharacterized protein LOC117167523 [Belonocnema kinseyi]XP_033208417.1 uncharacterized protein LOC117167523 [Belonocnema kinseyi]